MLNKDQLDRAVSRNRNKKGTSTTSHKAKVASLRAQISAVEHAVELTNEKVQKAKETLKSDIANATETTKLTQQEQTIKEFVQSRPDCTAYDIGVRFAIPMTKARQHLEQFQLKTIN